MRSPPASDFILESLQHWAISSKNKNKRDDTDNENDSNYNSTMEMCSICHAEDSDDDEHDDTESISSPEDASPSSSSSSLCGSGCSCAETSKKKTKQDRVIMMTQLPCGHVYHTACIAMWLARNCTCPCCRYELPTDDIIFEMDREERMRREANGTTTNQQDPSAATKTAPPPMGAFLVKGEYKQVIFRHLDKATSTTPTKYWNMPQEKAEDSSSSVPKRRLVNTVNATTA